MMTVRKVSCHLPVACLAVALAQEPNVSLPPQAPGDAPYKFGVTVVRTEGFRGDIYLLRPGTQKLPNFKRHKAVGSIYTPVLEDWVFHVVLPVAAYAMLVASALMAHSRTRPALFVLAGAALLLLFIGIHNAWDLVTYHVFVRRREKREGEQKE